MKRKTLIGSIFLALIVVGILYWLEHTLAISHSLKQLGSDDTGTQALEATTKPEASNEAIENPIQEVASNLSVPWEIVFLPDSSILVTERSGTLLHVLEDSREQIPIQGVVQREEGGLLGLALHPNYSENNWVYLYLTTQSGTALINRVERYTFDENSHSLSERTVLLDQIPGAIYHDGGRIAFGPDGYLYITTGDAQSPQHAQNTESLAGKIIRITDTGEIPQDNPFTSPVYSYGHRNPQGIAWDYENNLWSTEHGVSVPVSGFDEVNLIEAGANYGWPNIQGSETGPNQRIPIIQSGSSETWAPAALVIHENTLYFTGLKGESIYSAQLSNTTNKLENLRKHFTQEFGRLRALQLGPDKEWLYVSTSNTDGRGVPKEGDDRIIKIHLSAL